MVSGLCLSAAVWAHGEADDVLPAEAGVSVDAAIALRALRADQPLPSEPLNGYLLLGDAGHDLRKEPLEHAALGSSARFSDTWGARLAVGRHASDDVHLEAAWLQARHDGDDATWLLTFGRQRPALGPVLGAAGHLDRFGLVPLTQRMAVNGDWVDDGAQLSWRAERGARQWRADLGLWRGQAFPGAQDGAVVPGLHLGLDQGLWSIDGLWAQFRPDGRGSAIQPALGHSHNAPICDSALREVVCFRGRSDVLAASVRWQGAQSARAWPITLSAAGWMRRESGTLESVNGLVDYRGRNTGGWLEALWQFHPRWELAWRGEHLMGHHAIDGAGANLIMAETRLNAYRSATRQTLMLGVRASEQVDVRLEAGRESLAGVSVNFAALRVLIKTEALLSP